jgi:two-component system sensor histidine kinase BaeS
VIGTFFEPSAAQAATPPEAKAGISTADTETPSVFQPPATAIAAIFGGLVLLAFLTLLSAAWLARQRMQPLLAVREAVKRIAHGDLAVRVDSDHPGEIGELMRNVNKMAESLENQESARQRWMADLSQELRTPLTALSKQMDALAASSQPLSIEALASMKDETRALHSLVGDMQLLANDDGRALPCCFSAHDVTNLVECVLRRHAQAAVEADLTLGWAKARPQPLRICWDAQRIERVLNHVIRNSLQFTDAPGRIKVDLKSTSHCVQLIIEDSAPGVSPQEAIRIFEPQYRAHTARNCHSSGRGLGLAVNTAIVHAHDGLISAHPSSLGGLRIEIDLPVHAQRFK